ncbi:MAG: dTDP-4-dehydrorhamnose 3,5-epimerase [Candidatus Omnitrophota bacterium]
MSGRFTFKDSSIPGLYVAERKGQEDQRGYFSRLFCLNDFGKIGMGKNIVQINHSLTREKGTVRGLHFQMPPHAEVKIISCLQGEVFDVAVDIRMGSKTFLKWHAEKLSPGNRKTMIIPEGFAHGFQALTDNCELIYFHTDIYDPGCEGGLRVDDERIGIQWPLPVAGLSDRDKSYPDIGHNFTGVNL